MDKQMTVRVRNGDGRIKISIADNGVGIPAENLTRIFKYGIHYSQNKVMVTDCIAARSQRVNWEARCGSTVTDRTAVRSSPSNCQSKRKRYDYIGFRSAYENPALQAGAFSRKRWPPQSAQVNLSRRPRAS